MAGFVYLVFSLWSLTASAIGGDSGVVPAMSFEALDTLFDLEDRVKINTISEPVPLYRKDLDVNYVAYWQYIINGDEQLIVSAGPNTGDYKLVFQGPLPAMTKLLDRTAWDNGRKCSKYYMLSPEVILMCEDNEGHVIATTRDSYIKHKTMHNDTTLRYRYVEENCHKLTKHWVERAHEVKQDGIWDYMTFIPKKAIHQNDDDALENSGLFIVRRGQTVKIPITGKETIRLFSPGHEEHRLCDFLKICTLDKRGLLDLSVTHKTSYGASFVALTVPDSTQGKDMRFDLHVLTDAGLLVKRYYIDLNSRAKRGASYSAWTEISIADEDQFPDYDQFNLDDGRGCAVGCGPVAWAMVFGYLDRRSHYKSSVYGTGSQNLFRCGSDGTSGTASCVAPSRNNNAVKGYLTVLRGILRTFCLSGEGATFQGRMDDVEGFFRGRQTSGSPDIVSHKIWLLSFFGKTSSKVRGKALEALRAGWPVIAGIRLGGLFSQHYPVATKYRSRVKTERKCFLWRCRNKRTTEYEMFFHMGWGGRQNGWRSANMFFATYAKY